ncbi:MAG TPA: hypothetical protein VHQ23_09435, partial [Ilumatobacteraceae bacterium]|nr:hypothetical protein [Ilumatobacteraceae bacterium]
MNEELHDHDRGLGFDLGTLIARRRLLTMFAGAGLAVVAASCASDGSSSSTSAAANTTTAATNGSTAAASGTTATNTTPATSATTAAASSANLEAVPEETGGPFPGDGSNGPDVLSESGIVRSDIRSSFGTSTTTADGVPTTISLTLVDANGGAPMPGTAVYIWHCDAEGRYSLYSQGVTNENYLRGVQEADSNGVVTFTTVYPAC